VHAGIAALVNRINKQQVTVAVDGSLYRSHPRFPDLIETMTSSLINPGIEVSSTSHLFSICIIIIIIITYLLWHCSTGAQQRLTTCA